jgi:predicted enzyme related to lactoylglutathione lyase
MAKIFAVAWKARQGGTMSIAPSPTVVLFVSDVQRVSAFYRELASMQVLLQDDAHCVMQIEGFQLVIHALRGEPAVLLDKHGQIPVREDTYVKVCLPVESIAGARAVALKHGAAIKPSEHEWEARGFRACDGHDPEGNVIQVRENGARPR